MAFRNQVAQPRIRACRAETRVENCYFRHLLATSCWPARRLDFF